ncbi:hypothetical protein X275_00710 [Marinitoga sp. 1197]|uniref:DPP IV N-terminal domain-containing protein n=1 Tax=Marinitoga sp. 1197 TaxID=1428449 RepID=UPI0006417A29|nr:DPP IV N-terminal domain-containing protein [Marinitoga sp. 1197]KLO24238.1 hypothetical protein X275_00710 [Marinitoga sp. 1197]
MKKVLLLFVILIIMHSLIFSKGFFSIKSDTEYSFLNEKSFTENLNSLLKAELGLKFWNNLFIYSGAQIEYYPQLLNHSEYIGLEYRVKIPYIDYITFRLSGGVSNLNITNFNVDNLYGIFSAGLNKYIINNLNIFLMGKAKYMISSSGNNLDLLISGGLEFELGKTQYSKKVQIELKDEYLRRTSSSDYYLKVNSIKILEDDKKFNSAELVFKDIDNDKIYKCTYENNKIQFQNVMNKGNYNLKLEKISYSGKNYKVKNNVILSIKFPAEIANIDITINKKYVKTQDDEFEITFNSQVKDYVGNIFTNDEVYEYFDNIESKLDLVDFQPMFKTLNNPEKISYVIENNKIVLKNLTVPGTYTFNLTVHNEKRKFSILIKPSFEKLSYEINDDIKLGVKEISNVILRVKDKYNTFSPLRVEFDNGIIFENGKLILNKELTSIGEYSFKVTKIDNYDIDKDLYITIFIKKLSKIKDVNINFEKSEYIVSNQIQLNLNSINIEDVYGNKLTIDNGKIKIIGNNGNEINDSGRNELKITLKNNETLDNILVSPEIDNLNKTYFDISQTKSGNYTFLLIFKLNEDIFNKEINLSFLPDKVAKADFNIEVQKYYKADEEKSATLTINLKDKYGNSVLTGQNEENLKFGGNITNIKKKRISDSQYKINFENITKAETYEFYCKYNEYNSDTYTFYVIPSEPNSISFNKNKVYLRTAYKDEKDKVEIIYHVYDKFGNEIQLEYDNNKFKLYDNYANKMNYDFYIKTNIENNIVIKNNKMIISAISSPIIQKISFYGNNKIGEIEVNFVAIPREIKLVSKPEKTFKYVKNIILSIEDGNGNPAEFEINELNIKNSLNEIDKSANISSYQIEKGKLYINSIFLGNVGNKKIDIKIFENKFKSKLSYELNFKSENIIIDNMSTIVIEDVLIPAEGKMKNIEPEISENGRYVSYLELTNEYIKLKVFDTNSKEILSVGESNRKKRSRSKKEEQHSIYMHKWYYDNDKLFYSIIKDNNNYDLYYYSVSDNKNIPIYTMPTQDTMFDLSPNGKYIAWSSDGNLMLGTLDFQNNEIVNIKNIKSKDNDNIVTDIKWSKDSKKLAFIYGNDLYIYNANNQKIVKLTEDNDKYKKYITWNNEGTKIGYLYELNKFDYAFSVVSLDGEKTILIDNGVIGDVGSPLWFGKNILISLDSTHGLSIYNIETQKIMPIKFEGTETVSKSYFKFYENKDGKIKCIFEGFTGQEDILKGTIK